MKLFLFYKLSMAYDKKNISIFLLSYSTGIPFLITLSTLSYWLKEYGVSNKTIGLFVIVTLPCTFRFLWGPLVDHIHIPLLSKLLGKTKSWIFSSQLFLICCLIGLSYSNPSCNVFLVGIWAFGVSLASSLQDVSIQSYRIHLVNKEKIGIFSSLTNFGFRLGMLTGGGGALYIAEYTSWKTAFQSIALLIGIGLITILWSSPLEEIKEKIEKNSFFVKIKTVYYTPFFDLINNKKILYIIFFILFYKANDILLSSMTASFLIDMKYSKSEIASVYNIIGLAAMIAGGILSGIFMKKYDLNTCLIGGCILKCFSNLLFLFHSLIGYNIIFFIITIGYDKFIGMLNASALIGYFSLLCNKRYAATQYAMISSYGSGNRVLLTMVAGIAADFLIWPSFFLMTSLISLPVIYFIRKKIIQSF